MKIFIYLMFFVITGLWIFSRYGDRYWLADLLSNFVVQFIIAFCLIAILSYFIKIHSGLILLSLTITAYITFTSFHNLHTQPEALPFCPTCEKEKITVVQYNLRYDNGKIDDAISWLLEGSKADIIMLQEVDDRWKKKDTCLKNWFSPRAGR